MWACSSFCGSVWRSRPLGGRSVIMWRMSSGMWEGRCHHTGFPFLLLVCMFKDKSLTEEKNIYSCCWNCVNLRDGHKSIQHILFILFMFLCVQTDFRFAIGCFLPHRFIDCDIDNKKIILLWFHGCLYVFTHKVCARFTCALFIIQFWIHFKDSKAACFYACITHQSSLVALVHLVRWMFGADELDISVKL